jgi:tetratricopeptide (TPR) repeat protein
MPGEYAPTSRRYWLFAPDFPAFAVSFLLLSAFPLLAQAPRQATIIEVAAKAENYEAQGRMEDAAGEYQTILKIDPGSVAALNALGALCVKQGNFKEAISYYDQALKLKPREFGTRPNLGIASVKMQAYKSAVPALERSVDLNPCADLL